MLEVNDRPDKGTGSWTMRRRFMFATVAFCMGTVAYVLWYNLDTRPAETAVTMAFFVIASTVASYVFGAAWEDNTTRKVQSRPRDNGGQDGPDQVGG